MKKIESEEQLSFVEDSIVTISKGELLEYRIKRLFFHMGYYSKIGVIVKTSSEDDADIITDLDVYGIYFQSNFVSKRIWADCKSGKAKPLERISWIKGIRSSIRIDDVFFVKSGIRPSTKSFARRSSIITVDTKAIEKLENDYKIDSDFWKGSFNPKTQNNRLNSLKLIDCFGGNELKRISNYIMSNYWVLDEYARIKKSITGITQLSNLLSTVKPDQKDTILWAIYELICLFTLATLNVCRDLYYLPQNEMRAAINEGMISGEISAKKRAEIVEATYLMAIRMVKQEIPTYEGTAIKANIGITPPTYFDKYVDLVNRITKNPLDYFDILRMLDYLFMEYDLNHIDVSDEEMTLLFSNYKQAKNSLKTIIHFICDVCGTPRDIFTLLK